MPLQQPQLRPLTRFLSVLLVVMISLLCPTLAHGDAGLVIENPDGAFGFLTDSGHASVWISHGCLSQHGELYYCEHSDGVIVTGTGYWKNPGAPAIPAGLYFVGPNAAPVPDTLAVWNQNLASAYPDISPKLGRKYIGRVWLRSMRVLVFPTSAEEDRRVIEAVQKERADFHFSFYHHNCASYAQHVLELYRGHPLDARAWLDIGMTTPRSVELALEKDLRHYPRVEPRRYQFAASLRQRVRPARTLCESALFDPKYAVPILVLEPFLYPGFAGCYAVSRTRTGHEARPISVPISVAGDLTPGQQKVAGQLATYKALVEGPPGPDLRGKGQ